MNEYQKLVDDHLNYINEKLKKPTMSKKLNKLTESAEELFECPVQFNLKFDEKFPEKYSEIENGDDHMNFATDEGYWNYRNTLVNEINSFWLNIESKTFYMSGGISEFSVSHVLSKLDTIQLLCEDKKLPITIVINTFGGDAYAMMGIVDLIISYPVQINTVCYGQVMSAGAIILAVGKNRKLSKNSIMMIHDLQTFNDGSYKNIMNTTKHLGYIQERMYKILEENSNKDSKWWENTLQRDMYITPSEALELGLIDEII